MLLLPVGGPGALWEVPPLPAPRPGPLCNTVDLVWGREVRNRNTWATASKRGGEKGGGMGALAKHHRTGRAEQPEA
jgi:hypothetical protein